MSGSSVCKIVIKVSKFILYLFLLLLVIPSTATGEKLLSNDIGPLDEELYDRYATALTLYYDGEFEQALNYLDDLEGEVDEQKLTVWRARSLWMLGNFQAAIQTYTSLIENYPDVNDLRWEIAQLIVNSNESATIRKYLEETDDDVISPLLKPSNYKILERENSGQKTQKSFIYFEQGLNWDSNATIAPEDEYINIPLKGRYVLSENQTEKEDWTSTTYLHTLYRNVDGSTSLPSWETSASVYLAEYLDLSDEDNIFIRLETGPIRQINYLNYTFPIEYIYRSFDGDHSYQSLGIATHLKYRASDRSIVRGILQYRKKLYLDKRDENYNADKIRLFFGSEYVITPKKLTITANAQGFVDDKEKDLYSHYDGELSLGLRYHFSQFLKGKILYRYRLRQYRENQPGWVKDRNDQLHAVYIRISRELSKVISLNANISYENNESNTDLFDYEQVKCGISVSFTY